MLPAILHNSNYNKEKYSQGVANNDLIISVRKLIKYLKDEHNMKYDV